MDVVIYVVLFQHVQVQIQHSFWHMSVFSHNIYLACLAIKWNVCY